MGLRQDRLADEVRDVIASLFTAGQISDPRLEGVSITAVKISPDLQMASVYFRIYGDTVNVEASLKGFERAEGFLKKALSKSLDVRRVPTLRFFYDESIERGSRIEELLSVIKN